MQNFKDKKCTFFCLREHDKHDKLTTDGKKIF